LAGQSRILGPGHATTTEKLYRLGMICDLQRKTTKAEEMYRQASESFRNLFGPQRFTARYGPEPRDEIYDSSRPPSSPPPIFKPLKHHHFGSELATKWPKRAKPLEKHVNSLIR
jgi:hypothetical protein